MIRIVTFTPVWRRPEVFEICLAGIQRLRGYAPHLFQITPFFVVSEPEAAAQVHRFGFDYIYANNYPLGEKKNKGLAHVMRNYEFDYLLEIGSDDLVSNYYLDLMEPWMHAGYQHLIPTSCWMLDVRTRKTAFWYSELIIGLGRLIKREALEMFAPEKYVLWDASKNRGMDMCSTAALTAKGVEHTHVNVPGVLTLDIKSDENLNSINPFESAQLGAAVLASYFPEKKLLLRLMENSNGEIPQHEKEEIETIYFLRRMRK